MLEPAAEPGLAVALGGAGISLIDLVRLYSAHSNAGEVAQLRYRPNDPAAPGTPIFGPLAAWYVNDILAEAPAPPGVLPAEVRRGRRLAFKTGTSYGYRDFWAVGYDPGVMIGVSAGRPDGTPIPGGSGRLTAAPIMFKIADLLGPSSPRNDAPPPPGAILVGRQNLPPRLQRLDPRPLARTTSQTSGLTIVYPPDGALIEWRGEEAPLEMSGGKAPFRWLVDGKPLPPAPPRRPMYWQPDGIGFTYLAVIDADDASARTTVRLSPYPPLTPEASRRAGLRCEEPRNILVPPQCAIEPHGTGSSNRSPSSGESMQTGLSGRGHARIADLMQHERRDSDCWENVARALNERALKLAGSRRGSPP